MSVEPLGGDGRIARAAARLSSWLRSASAWFPLAVCLGVSPALLVWPLAHRDDLVHLFDNRLAPSWRHGLLLALLASLTLFSLAYAWLLRRSAAADPDAPLAERAAAWNRRLLPLLVLPAVAILMVPGVEALAPALTVTVIALATAAVGIWLYHLPLASPPGRALRPALGLALTTLFAVAQGLFFAWLSIRRHQGLETRIFDLGIYDNLLWHTSHGDLLGTTLVRAGSHVSAHVDPILVLLAPLYRLAPRPETLLVFQALWLASGAVPLYLLAKSRLASPGAGVVVASAYLLHPALHGACLFDFHSLTLAIPLVPWALLALARPRWWGFAAAIGLLLIVREDAAFLVASIALYALLDGRRPARGLVALAAAAVYLVALKLLVMPQAGLLMNESENAYSYESFYSDLIPNAGEGVRGIAVSLLTNPGFVLNHVLTVTKALYLAVMFLPTLFLPALARPGRVMLVYGLAFTLLGTLPALFFIGFQYVAVLLPFAVALVPEALAPLCERPPFGLDGRALRRALLGAVVVASVLTSWKIGGILPNQSMRPNTIPMARPPSSQTAATLATLERALAQVPVSASLAVSDRFGPHASNRDRVERISEAPRADYLLLDPDEYGALGRKWLDGLRLGTSYETALEGNGVLLLHRTGP